MAMSVYVKDGVLKSASYVIPFLEKSRKCPLVTESGLNLLTYSFFSVASIFPNTFSLSSLAASFCSRCS